MRGWFVAIAAVAAFSATGCLKVLDAYYSKSEHFPLGTAKVQQSDKSVERAAHAALTVLADRGYGIGSKEIESDSALLRANKGTVELVVSIKKQGEGSQIRVESDLAGNHGELWEILTAMDMLP